MKMKKDTGYWPPKDRLAATREHLTMEEPEDEQDAQFPEYYETAMEDSDNEPESDSDKSIDTPSQSTFREDEIFSSSPARDKSLSPNKNVRIGGTEYFQPTGPAQEVARPRIFKGAREMIKNLRFFDKEGPGNTIHEVYEDWKTKYPRNTKFTDFRKWIERNKVLATEMPSDKEWAQIAHEIKWVDEAHTPRIPVKY